MQNKLSREESWLLEEKYNNKICTEFEEDRIRLQNGEPLAYIIGFIPFLNTKIWLDSKPLIPRVETEYWVKTLIEKKKSKIPKKILDLGSGSGCISVALASVWQDSNFVLIEKDTSHHKTIKKNIKENNLNNKKLKILSGSWFDNISSLFDLIVANPPYIDRSQNGTEENVHKHEPHLALYSEEKGLKDIKIIISQAPKYLKRQGELWLEHEPEQKEEINKIAKKYDFQIENHNDQYGIVRFSILKKH